MSDMLQSISDFLLSENINKNEKLLEVINHVKENNSNLHLFGLLSDGGVHSHINHLFGLLDMCKKNNVENVYLDICLDGRDTYEKSALTYLDQLQEKIDSIGLGKINIITGRYYGMDRDNNFDRLKKGYDAIVNGMGEKSENIKDYIDKSYAQNITVID